MKHVQKTEDRKPIDEAAIRQARRAFKRTAVHARGRDPESFLEELDELDDTFWLVVQPIQQTGGRRDARS